MIGSDYVFGLLRPHPCMHHIDCTGGCTQCRMFGDRLCQAIRIDLMSADSQQIN